MNRRSFLKKTSAAALATSSLGGLATSMASMPALGADTTGYKAIVCVFLLGGMDGHDFLIPENQTAYDAYAQIRNPFISQAGGSRDRNSLLALSPDNSSALDGRSYGLPSNMTGLQSLFQSGEAAIVGNVGPLIEPVSKAAVESGGARLPPKLFSHNDQQSTWQASAPEGAQFGWGGRLADAALASGANTNADSSVFTSVTGGGNQLFLTGQNTAPYQVSADGVATIELLDEFQDQRDTSAGEEAFQQLRNYMRGTNFNSSNMIRRDMISAMRGSLDSNEKFRDARANLVPLTTQFPMSGLGQQLRAVAQTISMRDILLVDRQVFFVGIGGFDTHDNQATVLPQLQAQIDGALQAFNMAMKEIGANNDVTLFTASEFGRTLAINGDGTDHGWGSHQIVMGGAVKGRKIYGTVPPPEYGHEWDIGGGRLLPSLSVEQFAEPIGKWFGLTDQELEAALPNLTSFDRGTLNIL